ncbi:hypothetical protein MSG28_013124 [Choristoneura fumiferana]|uniref:Uncharacterized protein n=1 Tax=Choristoneura fumiferana TaxID=7141 RepID=A0ACC0KT95_CHOFU|nr:hypothetical protein MSG28_013124 [Choristoneura fumiferana]
MATVSTEIERYKEQHIARLTHHSNPLASGLLQNANVNILTVTIVLGAAVLSSSTVIKSPESPENGAIPPNFELLILHNNDMHARFEQTSQLSGACTTADRAAGKCYGGFPRVAHVVKEARRKAASGEGPPVLYLNAGDTYTGTAWFTIYKWKIAAEFINALRPDAVSFGENNVKWPRRKWRRKDAIRRLRYNIPRATIASGHLTVVHRYGLLQSNA